MAELFLKLKPDAIVSRAGEKNKRELHIGALWLADSHKTFFFFFQAPKSLNALRVTGYHRLQSMSMFLHL